MPIVARINRPRTPLRLPTREELLDDQVERCGHCMLLWPASQMIEEQREDGLLRVCPNGSSPSTTIDYTTRARERVAADAERYIPRPNFSLAPTELPIPPTVNTIEDAAGEAVFVAEPLRVKRGDAALLVFRGRSFPTATGAALALVAWPAGVVSSASAAVTSDGNTMALSFTINVAAPSGTHDIIFNGSTLRGVLRVR